MARGYYEMPQGKSRPVYGPPRPRRSPSGSPTNDGVSRTALPSSTFQPSDSGLGSRRLRIVVLGSASSSKMFVEDLALRATVEFVETISDGQVILKQQPDVVLAPTSPDKRAAWSPLSTDINRYISKGGRVVTQLSQLQHLLNGGSYPSSPEMEDF